MDGLRMVVGWVIGGFLGMTCVGLGAVAADDPASPRDLEVVEFPLGMEGYCPVTLTEGRKWKHGDVRFGAVHRRRTFLFAGEAEQQQFLKDPDRYTPVLVGCDVVKYVQAGKLVDGSAKYSLTFRKQVYLFEDEASLKIFWAEPHKFSEEVRQAMAKAEAMEVQK